MFRFDCHVHSHHSKDGRGTVRELAEVAAERGLHGFALTDHDTLAGHAEIQATAEATGLLIVPGIEVSSAEGHVLAIGVTSAIEPGRGLAATVAAIESVGGIAVVAHPLRMITGMGPSTLKARVAEGLVPAIEAINARERHSAQVNTEAMAQTLGRPLLGGSDAHWIHDIGTAYTIFEKAPKDAVRLVRMIHKGQCRPAGGALPRHKVWGHSIAWRARRLKPRSKQ